jgi:hypothetical protein
MVDEFKRTLNLAIKFKKVMKAKQLKQARAKCPDCPGYLQGRLHPNGHLHMRCDGTCGKVFME